MDHVCNSLLTKNAKLYELLDRSSVEKLIKEHLSGSVNRRLLIWSLLNVESFLHEFEI